MEFHESGLPQDPVVYQAFTDLMENTPKKKSSPPDDSIDIALRATRVLHQYSQSTGEELALPLIVFGTMPEALGGLKRNYNQKVYDLAIEAHEHSMTSNAYLSEASPAIKRLTLAISVVMFEKFSEDSANMREKLDQKIENLRKQAEEDPNFDRDAPLQIELDDFPIPLPMAFHTHVADCTKTLDESDTRLFDFFIERLNEYRAVCNEQMQFLESRGIKLNLPTEIFEDSRAQRPRFEDSGLPQNWKTKITYEFVKNDPRVMAGAFDMALNVARTLSSHKGVTDTAINLALLDLTHPSLEPLDKMYLIKKIDWDVYEVLTQHTLHDPINLKDAAYYPVDFQQALAAMMIWKLRDVSKKADNFFNDVVPHLGDQVPKEALNANLLSIQRAVHTSSKILNALSGHLSAPGLQKEFQEECNKFARQVQTISARFKTKPSPDASSDNKNDFTL